MEDRSEFPPMPPRTCHRLDREVVPVCIECRRGRWRTERLPEPTGSPEPRCRRRGLQAWGHDVDDETFDASQGGGHDLHPVLDRKPDETQGIDEEIKERRVGEGSPVLTYSL